MPALEISDLYQNAVLWLFSGYGPDGQSTIVLWPPLAIKCRWVEKKREVLDKQGNTIELEGNLVVAGYIPIDSIIWLGNILDFYNQLQSSTGFNPTFPSGLRQIKTSEITPDIKNRAVRTTYGAMRYKDQLPLTYGESL
jgi:hypothetical protein